MDLNDITSKPAQNMSPGQTSNACSSSSSGELNDETVSTAGDIEDCAHSGQMNCTNDSIGLSSDSIRAGGCVIMIKEDSQHDFPSQNTSTVHTISTAMQAADLTYPLPTEILHQEDKVQDTIMSNVVPLVSQIIGKKINSPTQTVHSRVDDRKKLNRYLKDVSCLLHLALFGILGVLTRYALQKLFGPGIARLTSDGTILYLDLPSNVVGSFLMGWWGVIFKKDITNVSENLALGLTTGYLGSLTTFSGWNQKMIELASNGQWLFAVLGFLLGMFLVAFSIIFGVDTAKGFRWVLRRIRKSFGLNSVRSRKKQRVESNTGHLTMSVVLILILAASFTLSGVRMKEEFEKGSGMAQLWFGCVVGPFGVWLRWLLARLNGQGLGKTARLRWFPFGTLMANVLAACATTALAQVKKEVNSENCNTIVTGIQLGFLGCLSTVSTFIGEFNTLRQSKKPWQAYTYATVTILVSFILGILIYKIPVWIEDE